MHTHNFAKADRASVYEKNTDDAIVFGVGVSEEFLRLHQAGVFTAAELELIRQWGFDLKIPLSWVGAGRRR